jgi:hypothetical protein
VKDEVTFEPLDKLDTLKEEMSKSFKGMDKNLDKLQSLQEPIADAKPRMKSMMDSFSQGMLDIRPFVPKSFSLFHGITDILSAIQAPANAERAREIKDETHDRLMRQSDSIVRRNESYANFLDNWKMPPEVATSFAMSGIGNSTAKIPNMDVSVGSSARPPGPASVVTPPYAGVLAGGSSGWSGGGSGGSELKDILAVLQEIRDFLKIDKNRDAGEEDDDETQTVENRRPKFTMKHVSNQADMPKGSPATVTVGEGGQNRSHIPETATTIMNMIKMAAEIAK